MEDFDLEDLGQLKLADEPKEKEEKPKPKPKAKVSGQALVDAMRKRAEETAQQMGQIYPKWNYQLVGTGAKVMGKLLEKRTVDLDGRAAKLFVVKTLIPTQATDRDGDYEGYTGELTVWLSKVLEKYYEDAEIGKMTFVEFLGKQKGQSGRYYNNFNYAQMGDDEVKEAAGG